MCVVLFWGELVCCRLGLCLCVFSESSSSFLLFQPTQGLKRREERVGTHGTIEEKRQSSCVIPSLDNVLTPDKVDCFQFHSVNFRVFSSSFFSLWVKHFFHWTRESSHGQPQENEMRERRRDGKLRCSCLILSHVLLFSSNWPKEGERERKERLEWSSW